jgi:hypothetical protein
MQLLEGELEKARSMLIALQLLVANGWSFYLVLLDLWGTLAKRLMTIFCATMLHQIVASRNATKSHIPIPKTYKFVINKFWVGCKF